MSLCKNDRKSTSCIKFPALLHFCIYRYTKLTDVADHFFPPVHKLQRKQLSEYSEVTYWRDPLPEISIEEIAGVTGVTAASGATEKSSSWREQFITSQQLSRGQRTRHYSMPTYSSNRGNHLLPSHNSIDVYDQSSDSEDEFDDLGMEMNLSENKRRKMASLWAMPFTVNSLFLWKNHPPYWKE